LCREKSVRGHSERQLVGSASAVPRQTAVAAPSSAPNAIARGKLLPVKDATHFGRAFSISKGTRASLSLPLGCRCLGSSFSSGRFRACGLRHSPFCRFAASLEKVTGASSTRASRPAYRACGERYWPARIRLKILIGTIEHLSPVQAG